MKEHAVGRQFRLMRNLMLAIALSALVIVAGMRGLERKTQGTKALSLNASTVPISEAEQAMWEATQAEIRQIQAAEMARLDESLAQLRASQPFEDPASQIDQRLPVFRQLENWDPNAR